MQQLLDSRGAAELLNVTTRFLQHDRTHAQTIPFIKINKLIRYDPADLAQFLEHAKRGGDQ